MPRILLANEFGAGRGHLVTLARLAAAFGPGFDFDAALARRDHEGELVALGATIFDGPRLVYDSGRRRGPGAVPTATWGEFLGDLGFSNVDRLRDVVGWWRHVLSSRRIDLLLADYAPLALLAARSLGVATVATGTGYGLPPPEMPEFPVLAADATQRLHDERVLLSNVNQVASEVGLPPLPGLPAVYRADLHLLRTLPMLDPYHRYRPDVAYLPPVTDIGPVQAGGGDEVFVYFSTIEFDDPEVIEALARLPLPRRGFLPSPPPEVAARLEASGMILEPRPVPVDLIARRSRLLLNAGQHGILCLGLYAGLPQVCLYQHREQRHHAECAAAAGVACVVPRAERQTSRLVSILKETHADQAMALRAADLATRLRRDLVLPPDEALRRAVEPLRRRLGGISL